MPWSTFGGLRNYSSKAIGAYFEAINGAAPFQMKTEEVSRLSQLGLVETQYLEDCAKLMKGQTRPLNNPSDRIHTNDSRFTYEQSRFGL